MKLSYRSLATSLLVSATLLLTACSFMHTPSTQTRSVLAGSPDTYLQQAGDSVGNQKQALLLQATAAYFYYGKFALGRQVLYQIQVDQLDTLNKTQYQLLSAQLALHDQQAKRALDILNTLTNNPILDTKMQIEALQLRALAQQQLNMPLESIKTYIQLTPLLSQAAANDANQRKIWHLLATVPTDTLTPLSQDNSDVVLQGWAALALLTRQYADQPQQLLQQLRSWQDQFANHPAKPLVSTDIGKFAAFLQTPQQVALLLPLHGPVAKPANAILNGILSAYYRAKARDLPVPTIKIYDTSTENIVQQYQKALAAGANFVLGPLTKANVQLLKLHGDLRVPTLALNYDTDDASTPKNLYEFALSPENEALTIAQHAAHLGYVNAATITPAGKWGENIVNTFSQQWQSLNGNIVNTLAFSPSQRLKTNIATLLNIDQSYVRRNNLQKIIGSKVKFSARRRQDIDFIFLNAFPQSARQIMPLLRFYYAGNTPVFATSQIYNGIPRPQRDRDLDGVQFPIMPWAINPSHAAQQLRQQAERLWRKSFTQNSLLYAFGIDAYTLITHMGQLQAFAKFGISANTGTLFIDDNHRIRRQLEWAQFINGKPKLLVKNNHIILPLKTTP